MRLIKIGIANINTTVGAFKTNSDKIIACMERMQNAHCTIGCFHEQTISGYPAEDFVQWESFVSGQFEVLERILAATKGINGPVFTIGLTVELKGHLYNSCAVICNGKILGIVPKEKLPTYGVFYDGRTYSRGLPGMFDSYGKEQIPFGDLIFRLPFGILGVEICEDIWSCDGPMRRRAYSGAEIIVNLSASPFRLGIVNTRKEMISTRASDNQVTIVYANQYGGNDSLVFDGGGYVNQNGSMILEAERWRENISFVSVDLDRTSRLRHENTTWRSDCEIYLKQNNPVRLVSTDSGPEPNQKEFIYRIPLNRSFFIPHDVPAPGESDAYFGDIIEALITGLDYFVKTKAFNKIGISLSGGKDSLFSLIVCYLFAERRFSSESSENKKRLIREFIHCFSMPSRFNSETTKSIARTIASELGVSFKEIPIEDAIETEIENTRSMLPAGCELTELTKMNIQARIRGERMLNWSNSSGGMWIQTGNMSEKAVGYTTIGGDMMGAYSLIANIPKTVIIALLEFIRKKYGFESVAEVLETKASAELAEKQEDEKDLMPFPVLDACMWLFAEEKNDPATVYRIVRSMWTDDELKAMSPSFTAGMLKTWVKKFVTLFSRSIFKWVQTPESVHVGKLELDRERALQLPVVQSTEWLSLDELDDEE
jgi:NAD+ synthase (glutamine-hydrolysing)